MSPFNDRMIEIELENKFFCIYYDRCLTAVCVFQPGTFTCLYIL